jgi:hypothetical protein
MLHCRFFMDFYLRATYILGCLRRILYLLWKAPSRRHLGQISYPAQAKFVVCDYTIENRLHHRRDVSLGEDACQTRTGPVPSILAQLNSTTLSLMDRVGVHNVARPLRYFDAHLEQALALVLTGHCSVF